MNNINNVMSLMDTSGMLLARNVMASGISKYDFYQFIRNNKLEKISHGVYLSPEAWEDPAYVLHLRCPQAVFSHD